MRVVILLWAYAGFAALALGQARHYAEVFADDATPARCRSWQAGGAAALVLAWALAVAVYGGAMGTVEWCVQISIGAFATVMTLSYWPRQLARAAGVAVLGAVMAAAMAMLV
ncbi:MAG: DUF3325 domain-containing protein [Rhodocyclaceae bacterium]